MFFVCFCFCFCFLFLFGGGCSATAEKLLAIFSVYPLVRPPSGLLVSPTKTLSQFPHGMRYTTPGTGGVNFQRSTIHFYIETLSTKTPSTASFRSGSVTPL